MYTENVVRIDLAEESLTVRKRRSDDGRLLPHCGVASGRTPERRDRAHRRPPDDLEPGRAVRLRCLHGESSERGRH